jgi:hypothetical protein
MKFFVATFAASCLVSSMSGKIFSFSGKNQLSPSAIQQRQAEISNLSSATDHAELDLHIAFNHIQFELKKDPKAKGVSKADLYNFLSKYKIYKSNLNKLCRLQPNASCEQKRREADSKVAAIKSKNYSSFYKNKLASMFVKN